MTHSKSKKHANEQQSFETLHARNPAHGDWRMDTQLVRGGTLRSDFGETSEAIFLTSGFAYDSAETAESRFDGEDPGFVYSRYINPTLEMLQQRLAVLEGAEKACVMASGMAAMFASVMCQVKAGDHVLASRALFSSCFYIITELLPRYGVEVTLVDGRDISQFEQALKPNTKCVFIETPSNPTLEIIDIAALAKLIKAHGAKYEGTRLIVDNIFATPLGQKPLELGADIVIYSTTKHMDGQGRTLGGAVLGSEAFIQEELLPFHRHTGPALSPFNAWVILKGLETFSLRMQRHTQNAYALAQFLEAHQQVGRVLYPGLESHPQHVLAAQQMQQFGSMVAFEVKGGKAEAFAMLNALSIADISNNLGDAKTLITHPATTTHSNLSPEQQAEVGITQNMLRLSVGLEDIDDLKDDFDQALKA